MRLTLVVALVALLVTPARADIWQMKQRDMWNTGRANFSPVADSTFFDTIVWQTKAKSAFTRNGMSMPFYDGVTIDGVGPGQNIVVGQYGWSWKSQMGMDRATGAEFWAGWHGGGGERIQNMTTAFSNDGTEIYGTNDNLVLNGIPFRLIGWPTDKGPGNAANTGNNNDMEFGWESDLMATPLNFYSDSPVVGPQGRIFLHVNGGEPHAATSQPGVGFTEVWAADTAGTMGSSIDVALYEDGAVLIVVGTGPGNTIKAWDGNDAVSGTNELWATAVTKPTGASATIDPTNGNIYVGTGRDDTYVVGLDKAGALLWDTMLYDWQDGVNEKHWAMSAGCLSHDGETYYFQTISTTDFTGELYAINTADGSLKWSYATGSKNGTGNTMSSSCPIVTQNGIVIVGNNMGDTFYAIQDGGQGSAVLLDTFAVEPGSNTARASATMADDGLLYLPIKTTWLVAVGGDGNVQNVFTAFQLTTATMPGDVDGNGVVNGLDLTAVLTAWDTIPGDALWNELADLDDNNVVNGLDLTEVISNWTIASASASDEASDSGAKSGRGKAGRGTGNVKKKNK
jgi:outer membrane protein assembly factor BamB